MGTNPDSSAPSDLQDEHTMDKVMALQDTLQSNSLSAKVSSYDASSVQIADLYT
jgi:hypothetical protein